MGIRNWFDDNLMIVESDEKNTPFFFAMIRDCRVVLCVIYLEELLSYIKITLSFKEIRRLRLDGVETMP
jgi:hypothetical protein